MRAGTAGLVGMAVLALFGGRAFAADGVVRIGVLSGASASRAKRNIDAFRDGLKALGYTEGKNLMLEYRHADENPDLLPELVADLVRIKVDLILATGTRPVVAAKRATSTIPIVAGGAGDLVGTQLVASLSSPGGNVTGFSRMATEIGTKRIELLKSAASRVSRIAVLWSTQQDQDELEDMKSAALQSGVAIQPLRLQDENDFPSVHETIAGKGAQALIILHSGFALSNRKRILALAAEHRLPSMCELPRWSEGGCLMSYGPDLEDLYRRAASYADKILQGAKPADLPVQRPVKFTLAVNMKTAKQLGIAFPASILYRADRVIK